MKPKHSSLRSESVIETGKKGCTQMYVNDLGFVNVKFLVIQSPEGKKSTTTKSVKRKLLRIGDVYVQRAIV